LREYGVPERLVALQGNLGNRKMYGF